MEVGGRRKWWNVFSASRRPELLRNDYMASQSGPPISPEVADARGRLARCAASPISDDKDTQRLECWRPLWVVDSVS